ncbi:MAG: glycosyltransferase family 1 protein [Geminicoccaceae bacterium]|nr:glycosyltransferase family 1 protein [Geminicoccaceae bacterium]
MRILLITDAWHPQVNGVVRTWQRVGEECRTLGHQFEVVSPDLFRTVPCPTYPEIRLAIAPRRRLERHIDAFRPNAVHIATEGPLGLSGRRLCLKRGWPFTTSYHTKFPEYVAARAPVPVALGYAVVRWFHRPARAVLTATPTLRRELEAKGFTNCLDWSRGVDTDLYHLDRPPALDLPRPVFAYVGRVAIEKNLEAFLDLDLGGTKLVVGDGPDRAKLERRYPDAVFAGAQFGEDLAAHYTSADAFVFPSRTDTFGLVMLEALASGLPVAAFPVTGPLDVVGGSGCAVLDEDLAAAAGRALDVPRQRCRDYALRFSWTRTARQFLDALAPITASATSGAAD